MVSKQGTYRATPALGIPQRPPFDPGIGWEAVIAAGLEGERDYWSLSRTTKHDLVKRVAPFSAKTADPGTRNELHLRWGEKSM